MPELPSLASVDQLKRQLKLTGNQHDDEVHLYLEAASNVARNILAADGLILPDPAPSDAVLATLFIAQHFWESQHEGSSRPGLGDGSGGDAIVRLSGYAVPHRAAELLNAMLTGRAAQGPQFAFPPVVAYPDSH